MKDCSNYNYKMHFKVTFFLIFIRKLSSSFISTARFWLKCFSLSTFIVSIDLYLFYCRFVIVRVQFYRQFPSFRRLPCFTFICLRSLFIYAHSTHPSILCPLDLGVFVACFVFFHRFSVTVTVYRQTRF